MLEAATGQLGSDSWSGQLKKSTKIYILRFRELADWEVPRPAGKLKTRTRCGFYPGRRTEWPWGKFLSGTGPPLAVSGHNRRAFQSLSFQSTKWVLANPKRWPWCWRKSWRARLWNFHKWHLPTCRTVCLNFVLFPRRSSSGPSWKTWRCRPVLLPRSLFSPSRWKLRGSSLLRLTSTGLLRTGPR